MSGLWRRLTTRKAYALVCGGQAVMWRDRPGALTWHRALRLLNTGDICEIAPCRVKRWWAR